MPKSIISPSSLPEINAETGTYFVRYRIITEDRNNISYWSPVYEVDPGFTYQTGTVTAAKNSGQVNIVWDSAIVIKDSAQVGKVEEYDIWLNWYKSGGASGDWLYQQRVATTSLRINIPTTYYSGGIDQLTTPDRLLVEIYVKGRPITRDFTILRLYNPSAFNV